MNKTSPTGRSCWRLSSSWLQLVTTDMFCTLCLVSTFYDYCILPTRRSLSPLAGFPTQLNVYPLRHRFEPLFYPVAPSSFAKSFCIIAIKPSLVSHYAVNVTSLAHLSIPANVPTRLRPQATFSSRICVPNIGHNESPSVCSALASWINHSPS